MFKWFFKSNRSEWEVIAEEDCPEWVRRRLKKVSEPYLVHLTFDEHKYVVLRGRHFEYRVSAGGQGGDPRHIERRLRARYR